MNERPSAVTMNDRERTFHLSPVQVIASALASITAAVLASFFGVAGTVIGAGVVSAAASVGNAVYGYWLRSTRKALGQTIPSAFKETIPSALKQPATTVRTLVGSGARVSGSSSGGTGVGAEADPDNTNEVPAVDRSWEVPPPGPIGPPPVPSGRGYGTALPPPGVPLPSKGRDLGARIEAGWSGLLRVVGSLRWRNIALATVAAFGLSMAAVTAVEALAKKPLSGIVGGSTHAGSTTSLGGIVGGSQSSKPAPAPSTPSSSTTTNPQTTTPNGSSTTTTSPSSSSTTTPSTPTTTPTTPANPSAPPGTTGSTPGTSGSSSGATSSGSSSSGASASGAPPSGGVPGTSAAGG